MAIGIPETLTAETSGKYIISIRLRPDGYSFSGYDQQSERGSFFCSDIPFVPGKPFFDSFKESVFANDCLTYPYKEVRFVFTTLQYTLTPDVFFDKEKGSVLHQFNYAETAGRILDNSLPENKSHLLFDIDEELYEFCCRSFFKPQFIHYAAPLLEFWKRQSEHLLYKQMYVQLDDQHLLISCFNRGKLLFSNSFPVARSQSIPYYILYVWKQLDLDALRDNLWLSGELRTDNLRVEQLRKFVYHVNPIEIPSEAYLMGGDVISAPLDLIALFLCES